MIENTLMNEKYIMNLNFHAPCVLSRFVVKEHMIPQKSG